MGFILLGGFLNMSIKVNLSTGRKKDLEKLLKSIAEFWGNSLNSRLSISLDIHTVEKDCE